MRKELIPHRSFVKKAPLRRYILKWAEKGNKSFSGRLSKFIPSSYKAVYHYKRM